MAGKPWKLQRGEWGPLSLRALPRHEDGPELSSLELCWCFVFWCLFIMPSSGWNWLCFKNHGVVGAVAAAASLTHSNWVAMQLQIWGRKNFLSKTMCSNFFVTLIFIFQEIIFVDMEYFLYEFFLNKFFFTRTFCLVWIISSGWIKHSCRKSAIYLYRFLVADENQ